MTPPVLVVGLGTPDRGDDGAGPAVIARLEGRVGEGVGLSTRAGNLLAMLGDWSGLTALICVDAAAPMGAPGRVHRLDVSDQDLPRELASPASSHALGLADTLAMGKVLGLLPPIVIVFAIEGEDFETGAPLSEAAARGVDAAASALLAELAGLKEPADA